ncbi:MULTISPECIES: hypothetical protein [Halanaerobium]|jgi:hypothetical protein|uniref:Uncharacterized protein n=1 Tax=Halanaerobium kushneri TaxID=56779 RepID=A0A1N6YFL8_9FIRM|nr:MULTISPECIES: hypothetical protein [Halanaerobium]RCW52550.1 hypothetical protein DFR80_12711 [Halanaerobium sp. ST460_2HS_T2]SIR13377.1 hypothetical protein SAMN05421834_11443 [Halanaerobium kushneri]
MFKKATIFILFILLLFNSISAAAAGLDDFDKQLLIRVFKDVDSEDIEYMARLGLNSKDISLILYYYSNSGKILDRDELDRMIRNRERINEFHRYFGMPAIIFDDDLIRFRHPYRERHFPPFNSKKYDKKYKFNGGTEVLKVRGNNYDYKYNNNRTGVEEKIEIKNKKYEYYYRDRNMIEMLEVHHANNKYSYYYKNLNTGRVIQKEGRGQRATRDNVYEELKEKYHDLEDDDFNDDYNEDQKNDDSGVDIQFDIKIDLSDLLN